VPWQRDWIWGSYAFFFMPLSCHHHWWGGQGLASLGTSEGRILPPFPAGHCLVFVLLACLLIETTAVSCLMLPLSVPLQEKNWMFSAQNDVYTHKYSMYLSMQLCSRKCLLNMCTQLKNEATMTHSG